MDAYELDSETPLLYLMYRELVATPTMSLEKLEEDMHFDGSLAYNEISDLERRALLRLFQQNGKRLHPKHLEDPQKKKLKATIGLHQTFILPLGPIGMQNLGGTLTDPGCEVCGKKTASRCMQCLSVMYCGKGAHSCIPPSARSSHFSPECQRTDWPSHKEACKSLKGGRWHKITLSPAPLPYLSMTNRLDPQIGRNKSKVDGPPTDIHGGKMFLAKFQVSMSGNLHPGDMLVYDRQRSFTLFWKRTSDPILFDEATRMIGSKLKFYRWIKHTGGYDYEICIDRPPIQLPVW